MDNNSIETLTQAAAEARAKANELKAALTDTSSQEEQDAAAEAETAAVEAETALTDAQAAAADQSGGGAAGPKVGDTCQCSDGRTGTVHSYDEGLICIPNADQG
jgi:hypothetical protein